jgi:type II secretory pathway pseudopilin PulG
MTPLPTPPARARRRALTLVELVVGLSVLAVLGAALVPRLRARAATARDLRRVADVAAIAAALERHRADLGAYPAPRRCASAGGWDVSYDGAFLPELVAAGYLGEVPRDPIDDASFHYRYYRYAAGAFGCEGEEPFFVLGVRAFETPGFAERHAGGWRCGERDWSAELAHVVGGGGAPGGP